MARRRPADPLHRGDAWAALFVHAASPGAVFRLLERRAARAPDLRDALSAAFPLYLTEANPPDALRALVCESPDALRALADAAGGPLSEAFPPAVTLLWARDGVDGRWGCRVWRDGGVTEEGEQSVTPAPPPTGWRRLFHRPSVASPTIAALQWGSRRDLCLVAVPALRGRYVGRGVPGSQPVVDYAAVARLDQKNLLVEDAARLYRFAPVVAAPPPPDRTV